MSEFIDKLAGKLKAGDRITLLEPSMPSAEAEIKYVRKLVVLLGLLICVSVAVILFYLIFGKTNEQVPGYIEKNEPGKGSAKEHVIVSYDGVRTNMDIVIPEREMSIEECFEKADCYGEYLTERIRELNGDLSCIGTDMNLPSDIEGSPFSISYKSENTRIIGNNGRIRTKDIPEEGITVDMWIVMKYADMECLYPFEVTVIPPELTEEQLLRKRVSALAERENSDSGEEKDYKLPTELNEQAISWETDVENKTGQLVGFAILVIVTSFLLMGEWLKRELKKREEELASDYSELISKLTILIGAGFTVKKAFEYILEKNEAKCSQGRKGTRYLYGEIRRMIASIDCGNREKQALEEFGKRCGSSSYLRLSVLLSQNLRKGNSELTGLLRAEAQESFRERRENIKRKGEEAGTKLLLPMTGMMIVVFVIVLYPALSGM